MYDIVIVGGSVAGLYYAYRLIENFPLNQKILLIEKKSSFGDNVRCAQGVSLKYFKKYIPFHKRYVKNYINKIEIKSIKEVVSDFINYNEGVIIDRKKLEFEFGEYVKENIDVWLDSYVFDVKREGNGFKLSVKDLKTEEIKSIYTKFLVAADGAESKVFKSLGIRRSFPLKDLYITSYKLIKFKNKYSKKDVLEFYFGNEVAPGGYLWVFPQDDYIVNVGLGVSGELVSPQKTSFDYLKVFFREYFPYKEGIDYEVLEIKHAPLPTTSDPYPIVDDRVIGIGDSSNSVNPLTGAGIIEAFSMANIAVEETIKGFQKGDLSKGFFRTYQKRWKKLKGKYNPWFYKLREEIKTLDSNKLHKYKLLIDSIPPEKRTFWNFLKKLLIKNPFLLWQIKDFWK